jgi:hypothetical protein
MSNAQWFYSDAQQQQLGPVTFAQVQQLAASGQIQPTTLIWTEGMPYNAPATYATPAAANGYPAPFVKKTSFKLYMGATIASFILVAIALASLFAVAKSAADSMPDLAEERRQIATAGTAEEMKQAQENMDKKRAEFSQEISGTSAAGAGIGMLGLLAAWGISIFAAVYGYLILYRSWHVLQPGGARTTPGQAVGFMFIPVFNIYWIFNAYVGWSTDWNRIRRSYPNLQSAPTASGGMCIAAFVCMFTLILSPVGIILFLIYKKQMCDTINFFAANQAGAMNS